MDVLTSLTIYSAQILQLDSKNIALAMYSDTVDAVIKADTRVVGTDDMVVVTGEAVQFDMVGLIAT